MRAFFYSVVLAGSTIAYLGVGCQWEPPRDNPLHTGSERREGNLAVRVTARSGDPIPFAVVTLAQLGRFEISDSNGWALFRNIPAETLWVSAYRSGGDGPDYAPESTRVIVTYGGTDTTNLQLDALPSFLKTQVHSLTIAEGDNEQTTVVNYRLRLTTLVEDPDGFQDLKEVEWFLYSNSQPDSLIQRGKMDFRPDSSIWWAEVPGDSFPTGRLDRVLTHPFVFKAIDRSGHQAQSQPAYLARVIHEIPKNLSLSATGRNPTFDWDFIWDAVFQDPTDFVYLLRVWNNQQTRIVYQKEIPATRFYTVRHSSEVTFEVGRYHWEIWTIDIFGNRARSRQIVMTVS